MHKKVDEKFTALIERLLKKIHWKNTKSNQQILSMILGYIISIVLIMLRTIFS